MATPIFNVGDIVVDKASGDKGVISEVFEPGAAPPEADRWVRHPDNQHRYSVIMLDGSQKRWMTSKYMSLVYKLHDD